MKDHKIEIGSGDRVVIDKLFGPTIFADLRITADYHRGCWVIERDFEGEWTEFCTIPSQSPQDFKE